MEIMPKMRISLRWGMMLFFLWTTIEAQTRYIIPEEQRIGSVVGNIAKDLGLQVADISDRKLKIASDSGKQYFSVDLGKGELIVSERIDRESLCGQAANCLLTLQVVIQDPLKLHRVEVEVQDINDNAPSFISTEHILNIAESTSTGARFILNGAKDPDVGSNSVSLYKMNPNDFFVLNMKTNRDGSKIPELVLKKSLDRENHAIHQITLTALDGGNPVRTGTTEITVNVLDNNDNAPIFYKSTYDSSLRENSAAGTVAQTVKAVDADEGINAEIMYSFAQHTPELIQNLFSIDSVSGQIIVNGILDYEESHVFEFGVRAIDKGTPAMEGHCTVHIEVLDVNDNEPEIVLTSLPEPVKEDEPLGAVVALITTKDLDSNENGKIVLSLTSGSPFKLKSSFSDNYEIVTDSKLNREEFSEYVLKISASDCGSPSLSTHKEVIIRVIDVNDNAPVFSQLSYTVYMKENGIAGSIMFSVSASDQDQGDNAKITYSLFDSKVQDVSLSSYVYINSENGSIYSMHSFDYETQKVFQIQVQAKDHGSPVLSSNVTVHVFILDENDNAPNVIYPTATISSVSQQPMARFAKAGHLVTKVTAVDADSGHNAWISYRLAEATDTSLFSVNLYTGEVRTKRPVSEQDDSSQSLLIEIKDNGEPAQSTTITINILVEDGINEPISDFRQKSTELNKTNSKITFYLIVSLASVSVFSLLTFLILVMKCIRNKRSSSSCCMRRAESDGYNNPNRNLQIQLNTDGPIKYVEVLGGDMLSQSQSFRSCLSPMSEFSDFTLVKPNSTGDFNDTINVLDASLPDSAWTFESQQQQKPQPNDWRFTMNQRPGPSGAGPRPEEAGVVVAGTGPWPNPPTEAEQLQALIAAANVSEATATLGPRYNAQFPMQHVPDYRQNVYIPGSTATLTANPQQLQLQQQQQQQQQQQALPAAQAMPQVDAPKVAQTPASKKKSTKKDKK